MINKNIARIHNFYQAPGGEDQTLAAESALLVQHGHEVATFFRHNSDLNDSGLSPRVSLARAAVWNAKVKKLLKRFLIERSIDVAHFHNTMPLISPAAYYSAFEAGVPIVQTVHNYRTFCPASTLYRDGAICELCVGRRFAFPAVRHGCYRNNRLATLTQATTNAVHRMMHSDELVDAYICMNEFSRQKAIEGGFPAKRIHIKPHFVYPVPMVGEGTGGFAVYVGRLAYEKGLRTLVRAWALAMPSLKLCIIGDGPDREIVQRACAANANIQWLGQLTYERTLNVIRDAAFLIFPSEWYETFGRVIIEAFACGTPVVGSALGGHQEMIAEGENGLLFSSGDADDLAAKIIQLESRPLAGMRKYARQTFEEHYAAEPNYVRLMEIYTAAGIHRKGQDVM